MATAVFTARLETDPTQVVVNGKEQVQAHASIKTSTPESLPVIVRAWISNKGTGPGPQLRTKKKDSLVLITGEASIGEKDTDADGYLILAINTICDATNDQFINDFTAIGYLGKDPKIAEKSTSNSLGVSRWPGGKKTTSWFQIRGFGFNSDKLKDPDGCPKGTLVEINGMVDARKNKEGKLYPEIKLRSLISQKKKRGDSMADPSKDSSAAGYDHSQFTGEQDQVNDMPTSQSWN